MQTHPIDRRAPIAAKNRARGFGHWREGASCAASPHTMEAIIMKHQRGLSMGLAAGVVAGAWLVAGRSHVSEARADERPNAPAQDACAGLPDNARLARALKLVVHGDKNGGSGNEMWGGVVNRDGVVCSI